MALALARRAGGMGMSMAGMGMATTAAATARRTPARTRPWALAAGCRPLSAAAKDAEKLRQQKPEEEDADKTESTTYRKLLDRTVVEVTGPDATHFLQGIITNDLTTLRNEGEALFAAFLNNKGRMVAETMIHRVAEDAYLLDLHEDVVAKVLKLLKMFKLRADVTIQDAAGNYNVWAIMGGDEDTEAGLEDIPAGAVISDPRDPSLGYRVVASAKHEEATRKILGKLGLKESSGHFYDQLRYLCGIPEGLEVDGAIPLEFNLEKLNGVNFHKGCYTGQELVARTHFKGLVRKRLVPLTVGEHTVQERGILAGVKLGGATQSAEIELPAPVEWGPDAPEPSSKKTPGKLIAFSPEASIGLALMRLEEDAEEKWLQDGIFQVNGQPARVPKFPSWWNKEVN